MDTHTSPQTTKPPVTQTTKHDLALAYFPTLKPAAAERKFRRWINENPYLMKRLKKYGYSNFQKVLTPKQIRVIFGVLGEP